jgi:archaellum component FlaC
MRLFMFTALLAVTALAATDLEPLRLEAKTARAAVSTLKGTQLEQRAALSAASEKIDALKIQSKGKLFARSDLEKALKESQALSNNLTELAAQMSQLETASAAAQTKLVEALTQELNRLRDQLSTLSDRTARQSLLRQMREVRQERASVSHGLHSIEVAALALKPTEDPEELLEQADLIKDNEDKARRDLKTLEARIKSRREEVELDKRMQRFSGEESMFDDQDRRLRLTQTTTRTETAAAPVPEAAAAPGGFGSQSDVDAPPKNGSDSRGPIVRNGSDARPQLGSTPMRVASGDDELDDLEVQRLRLKSLADELKAKAAAFEKRAASAAGP